MIGIITIIIIGIFCIIFAIDIYNKPVKYKIIKPFKKYIIIFKTKLGFWHRLRYCCSNGIDFDTTYTIKFKTYNQANNFLLTKDIDIKDKDYKEALNQLNKEF